MPGSKKSKSTGKNRLAGKVASKRRAARPAAKTAVKQARREGGKRDAMKAPPAKSANKATVTPLAKAALAAEPERKPAKKAESRANRPPAALPIPQSTFFF